MDWFVIGGLLYYTVAISVIVGIISLIRSMLTDHDNLQTEGENNE